MDQILEYLQERERVYKSELSKSRRRKEKATYVSGNAMLIAEQDIEKYKALLHEIQTIIKLINKGKESEQRTT